MSSWKSTRYDYHHPKKEVWKCLMGSTFVGCLAGALMLTMPVWMILLGLI